MDCPRSVAISILRRTCVKKNISFDKFNLNFTSNYQLTAANFSDLHHINREFFTWRERGSCNNSIQGINVPE